LGGRPKADRGGRGPARPQPPPLFPISLTLLSAQAATVYTGSTAAFERVEIDLVGYVQPRFTLEQQDPAVGHPGELGFGVRRARLETGASFMKSGRGLELGLSLEMMPEPRLQDAWAELRLADPLILRVGQFKSPSTRWMLISSASTLLQDGPAIEGMAPAREIGAQLGGSLGQHHLAWAFGAFNGEKTNRTENVNRELLYAGRVTISPLGAPSKVVDVLPSDWSLRGGDAPPDTRDPQATFTLGGRGFRNLLGSEGTGEGVWGLGLELFAHYRWVNLQGEWMTGQTDWEDPAIADYKSGGFYGQLALFPPLVPWAEEHLALVARFEQSDAQDPLVEGSVPLVGATDPAQERREILAGVVLFAGEPWFKDMHRAKVQLTYSFRQELEGLPYANDELLLASQLSF
jgi:hypothetical protein